MNCPYCNAEDTIEHEFEFDSYETEINDNYFDESRKITCWHCHKSWYIHDIYKHEDSWIETE